MHRASRLIAVGLLLLVLWGCQHKPPPLNIPNTPVIEYGRPGAVTH